MTENLATAAESETITTYPPTNCSFHVQYNITSDTNPDSDPHENFPEGVLQSVY